MGKPNLERIQQVASTLPFYQNFEQLAGLDDLVIARNALVSELKPKIIERKEIDQEIITMLASAIPIPKPAVMIDHLMVEKVNSTSAAKLDKELLKHTLLELGVGVDVIETAFLMTTSPGKPYSYVKVTDTLSGATYSSGGDGRDGGGDGDNGGYGDGE